MNRNEIGTIITSLRDADKTLFLILGHLEEMRQRGADYQTVELAYNIIHEAWEATCAATKHMLGVQSSLKK